LAFIALPATVHQAAIAGKVIDAQTRQPVSGILVTMTSMPDAFVQWIALQALRHGATWAQLADRPDRKRTAEDGCFCFSNVPSGSYTISLTLPGGAHRYGTTSKSFTVTRNAQNAIVPVIATIELPPTGVRGRIMGPIQEVSTPLHLARVRVDRTGEQVHTRADGEFYLTGVELGIRTVHITASGFDTKTTIAQITSGTIADLGTIELTQWHE
jgi:hypothetical protein